MPTELEMTKARAQYLAWLREKYPELYDAATQGATDPQALSGFFDSLASGFSSVVNNVTQALPQLANTYSQYKQAEQIIKLNNQRAAQGLPPVSIGPNGQLMTAGGVPYTDSEWQLASSGGNNTTLLLAGGALLLLGFFLLRK